MGGISILFLMGIFSVIFFAYCTVFIGVIAYTAISYLFESISVFCMCKNLGYKPYAAAWVPFYQKYLLGRIVGNRAQGAILGLLNLAVVGFGIGSVYYYSIFLFGLFLAACILGFVLDMILAHKIYKSVTSRYGDILTIVSVLSLGLLRPVILFIIRNKVEHEKMEIS